MHKIEKKPQNKNGNMCVLKALFVIAESIALLTFRCSWGITEEEFPTFP